MDSDKREQVRAMLQVVAALGEAIRDLGSVPSGHLYAQVMGQMSLQTYESAIGCLVEAGLVRREASHMLVWVA